MARAANRDWLADEFGDLRPEVAQALREENAQGEGRRAGAPPHVPPRRRAQALAEPLPPWLPKAILLFVIGVGLVLGVAFAALKMKRPAKVPAEVIESLVTTVAVPNAKLRAEPGTYSSIRLVLQPNQQVEVIGLWNGWANVHVAREKGWVYAGLLRSVGHDVLGPATVLKPIKVKTETGPIVLYLGQKLLIERNAGSGYVVAVLPDDRRVTVPSSRLLFTAGN